MSIIQGTSKAASGGYEIDQSIRFDKTTSSHLSKTYGSAGNRRTWTFSTWFKRGQIDGSRQILFAATGQAYLQLGPDAASREMITITNEGAGVDLNWYTTAVYRDPSAWYHLVWQFDSTQATADNRTKLYINGVQVTDFTKAATPDLNLEGAVSNNVEHKLGEGHVANHYFDGYQAEINFIDGTALDPTSFGETNADGVWVPIAYTNAAGYGANGFYITGENAADLGEDFSGNGNDFTSSGLATTDQMLDTPTDNYATLNSLNNAGLTISDGNLTASYGTAATLGVTATLDIDVEDSAGYYWEVELDVQAFATPSFFALVKSNISLTTNWYSSALAYLYRDDGLEYEAGVSGSTWTALTAGDVLKFAARNGNVYLGINGTWLNSGDPEAETGALWTGLTGKWIPAYQYNRGGGGTNTHTVIFDFGQSGFSQTKPTGFKALSTANLPDPTIALPTDHFQTVLDTGANIKTTAEALYTDQFEWIKDRANVNNHQLIDSVRGTSAVLQSNSTGAETTYSAPSGNSVAWVWKANGSGSSNTDGSITSTVSANQTAGFSIGTYTGTGSNATIGHGLGVAPALVIIKERTGTYNGGWYTYHESTGATGYVRLQTIDAFSADSTFMNNTAPTSSVFSLGTNLGPNGTTTYVFYAFAEVEGFSKFGSYTGNGSSDGPFINCGFRPAFVMYKRTDSTDHWIIKDDVRSNYNPNNLRIFPNQSAAEDTSVNGAIDIVSNGFKVRSNDTIGNASGGTYIYAAFARSPFKTANAR